MNKQEFLEALALQLTPLCESDRKQSVDFYAEMIDDCMKGGASEEEVVALLDPVEAIAGEFLRGATARTRRRWWRGLWQRVRLVNAAQVSRNSSSFAKAD